MSSSDPFSLDDSAFDDDDSLLSRAKLCVGFSLLCLRDDGWPGRRVAASVGGSIQTVTFGSVARYSSLRYTFSSSDGSLILIFSKKRAAKFESSPPGVVADEEVGDVLKLRYKRDQILIKSSE